MTAERLLVLLLRAAAIILLLATAAIFLPHSWMQRGHEYLGLGELPELPLAGYLTRSISALYATLGAFTWVMANDVHRYRPMVSLWAWFHVVFGVVMLGVDWHSGMPWYWTAIEGPGLFGIGVLTLGLLARVDGGGASAGVQAGADR